MVQPGARFLVALAMSAPAFLGCSSDPEPSAERVRGPGAARGGDEITPPPPAASLDGGPGTPGTSTDGGTTTSPSNGADKPRCKYAAHKTGLTPLTRAGGLAFTVYAPATYDPARGHGVVILMHGQDSDGVGELTTLWKPIADAESLVLVAPRGSRPATNGEPGRGNWATADLAGVLDVMDDVDDCYHVLTKKHVLWGFSAGTFYGYLLGLGASTRFSALAMGAANTSFARQNGLAPASAEWPIPVSHVHGAQDFNPIALTYRDRDDFQAAGHVFTLREHPGGHTITPAQVRTQYDDVAASVSP